MKAIKIILPILLIIGIALFIWVSIVRTPVRPDIPPEKNMFTERIEQEIDSINNVPTNVFCKELYGSINYRLNDYFNQKELGKTDKDNEQWRYILSKNLYSAYAVKFTQQAMYVFAGSEWESGKLNFIRKEMKSLQMSPNLKINSAVSDSFIKIETILKKYDEGFVIAKKCAAGHGHESESLGLICLGAVAAA